MACAARRYFVLQYLMRTSICRLSALMLSLAFLVILAVSSIQLLSPASDKNAFFFGDTSISLNQQIKKDGDRRFNLLDDWELKMAIDERIECTLENMNARKMAQNHPCVIDTIRRQYLDEPSPRHVPYQLEQANSTVVDLSHGQVPIILGLLNNKTGGFFIECGAFDGEFISNTLYLESRMNWTGLLVEADATSYQRLSGRNRKAWKAPVCLSLESYPTQVTFQPSHGKIIFLSMADQEWSESMRKTWWDKKTGEDVTVQCFPLYSILLAISRTMDIDFFSLDIDGHELKVLKTIPWHKVHIKTITVETLLMNKPNELEEFLSYMESSGYVKAKELYNDAMRNMTSLPLDIIFVHKMDANRR